jgi:uncharacterized protein YggE
MPDVRQLVTTAAVAVLAIAAYQAVHDTSPAPAASSPRASGMLQPFMRFTGSGTTTMRPDQGTVSFSTHGTGTTLLEAQNQASQAMHSLIAKLNADGVPGIEMQTNGVQGYQRHGPSGGYAADQSLTVTVHDVSKIGKLLADGAATGAQSSSGVDFSTSDQRRSYNNALSAAIGDARSKADAAAAAAGLHVSGVVSVDETEVSQPYYGMRAADQAMAPGPVSVPIKRGTQQMSAQVTVVFAYTA